MTLPTTPKAIAVTAAVVLAVLFAYKTARSFLPSLPSPV